MLSCAYKETYRFMHIKKKRVNRWNIITRYLRQKALSGHIMPKFMLIGKLYLKLINYLFIEAHLSIFLVIMHKTLYPGLFNLDYTFKN